MSKTNELYLDKVEEKMSEVDFRYKELEHELQQWLFIRNTTVDFVDEDVYGRMFVTLEDEEGELDKEYLPAKFKFILNGANIRKMDGNNNGY